jgi:hypothetical protein
MAPIAFPITKHRGIGALAIQLDKRQLEPFLRATPTARQAPAENHWWDNAHRLLHPRSTGEPRGLHIFQKLLHAETEKLLKRA